MSKVLPSSCIDGIRVGRVVQCGDDRVGANERNERMKERLGLAVSCFQFYHNNEKKVSLQREALRNSSLT